MEKKASGIPLKGLGQYFCLCFPIFPYAWCLGVVIHNNIFQFWVLKSSFSISTRAVSHDIHSCVNSPAGCHDALACLNISCMEDMYALSMQFLLHILC